MEEEFDAKLLCPDVIIEEKYGSIITGSDDNIETALPLPSPIDYNIMGHKAHFHLNNDEESLRSEIYTKNNPVQNCKLHCTACNCHLGSALNCVDNVYVHPLLYVLICHDCFAYYTGGEFEKDEDGAEMFCRWCGQGGQVFCCSKCPMVFCKMCVKINFNRDEYITIRDKDYWECFRCDPNQIMHLKVQCYEYVKYVATEMLKVQNGPEPEFYSSIDHTKCCLSEGRKKRSLKEDPDFVPFDNETPKKILPKRIKTVHKEETPNPKNLKQPVTQMPCKRRVNFVMPGTSHDTVNSVHEDPGSKIWPPPMNPPLPKQIFAINIPNNVVFVPNIPNQIPPTMRPTFRPILPQNAMKMPAFRYAVPAPPMRPNMFNQGNQMPFIRNTNLPPDDNLLLQEILRKKQETEKHMLTVALANSTFASTLLQVNHLFNDAKSVEDVVLVHDILQKSLKILTDSLIEVKNRLRNVNFGTSNVAAAQSSAQGAPRYSTIKLPHPYHNPLSK